MIPKTGFVNLLDTDRDEYRREVYKWDKVDSQQFEPFIGKKVTVEAEGPSGLFTRQGRIIRAATTGAAELPTYSSDRVMFIQKGHRTKGLMVTSGLYDSFRSTITIRKIKEGWD